MSYIGSKRKKGRLQRARLPTMCAVGALSKAHRQDNRALCGLRYEFVGQAKRFRPPGQARSQRNSLSLRSSSNWLASSKLSRKMHT